MSEPNPNSSARPQYHYFYGSTDTGSQPPGSPSHQQQEQESLIGEALVNTDTEEDVPMSHHYDLQHVVVTTNGHHTSKSHSTDRPSKSWLTRLKISTRRVRRNMLSVANGTRFIVLFIIAAALLITTLVVWNKMVAIPESAVEFSSSLYQQPFPSMNRAASNDPVPNIIRAELFHPSLLANAKVGGGGSSGDNDPEDGRAAATSFLWKSRPTSFLKVPFPTGAFWTNLVLAPTADRGFSYPVVAYPYSFKWSDSLLQASYPALHRRVEPDFVQDTHYPDFTFGSVEPVVSRSVVSFDPLSVTLRFSTSDGLWESYLVQGSPYITIRYEKLSPVLQALSILKNVMCPQDQDSSFKYGICSSEGGDGPNNPELTLHGVQFILQTQEGLTWLMFASEPITLVFNTLIRTTATCAEPFTGVIRLALVPPTQDSSGVVTSSGMPKSSSTGLRRLIYHAGTYPVGASVGWEFRTEPSLSSVEIPAKKAIVGNTATIASAGSKSTNNRVGTVQYRFITKKMAESVSTRPSGATDTLLMLALPHHVDVLPKDCLLASDQFDLVFRVIKGNMTPVVGATWTYDEDLPQVGFDDFDVINYSQMVAPEVRNQIVVSLAQDFNRVLPTRDENVYGFGKQTARLAQLVHIANMLNKTNATIDQQSKIVDPLPSMLDDAIYTLSSFLIDFLCGHVIDSLVYDSSLGGLVSKNGLADPNADFGNGRYNDHHFHYGYLLYACAIMGKLNATFVTEYGKYVDTIMNDVAYFSNSDSQTVGSEFFPLARHKSWFDGHSFASGLFPFGNGKSQESTSEAINCYYGAYLWSLVRHGAANEPEADKSETTNFLRLLLATEIRGAKTYWHMLPPDNNSNQTKSISVLFNPVFLKEGGMNGNLGMLDADRSTWFGTERLYVHMINFMPVTGITSTLFTEDYVSREYNKVLSALGSVEMAWRGYVVCDHAIMDPMKAWSDAQELVSYELDAALSKSQVLYWISTRAGFNFTTTATASSSTEGASTDPVSTMCKANAACVALGLSGFCCPTPDGVSLECCNNGS